MEFVDLMNYSWNVMSWYLKWSLSILPTKEEEWLGHLLSDSSAWLSIPNKAFVVLKRCQPHH